MLGALIIVLVIILIIGLVYSSRAVSNLPDETGDLADAYSKLDYANWIGWISAILIVFFGIYFLFETYGSLSSILFIIIFILIVAIGVLDAIATSDIGASTEYTKNTDKTAGINVAYNDAYTATALTLGSAILLIVIIIAYKSGEHGGVQSAPIIVEEEEV